MAWKEPRGEKKSDPAEWVGFSEKGVRFEGRMEFSGTFRLSCEFKGRIRTGDTLILGEAAQVEAEVEAGRVVISGRFHGTITAKERVTIQPGGVVTGEIQTPCLAIEPGGIFDGRCVMLNEGEGAQPVSIPIHSDVAALAGKK